MRRTYAAVRSAVLIAAGAGLLTTTGHGWAAPAVRVVVNSQEMTLSPPAKLVAGQVVAPLKPILGQMGYTALWDAKASVLSFSKGPSVLRLRPGKREATVDGRAILLPMAPVLRSGTVWGPVRAIVQALGATVAWDARKQTLLISARVTGPAVPGGPMTAQVTKDRAIAIATQYLKSIDCYPQKVTGVEAHQAQAPANNYWEEVAGRGKIVSGAPLRPCWVVHFDYESFVPGAWMEVYVDAVTGKVIGGQQTR
ncbi:MAG: copper amine oxidase N-terminal domain-containing protein [Armatimonadetes bacterium]|nr:copper amine oxidase N-terminal domain-containing protein [Armatimonadota bacterium]